MHISFNGVIAVYTYNCPYAHKLRNIEHCYVERESEQTKEIDGTSSRRAFGIEQHKLVGQYIKKETDDFEYITDTIEWFREQNNVQVETQNFYDLSFSPLLGKPTSGDYISARADAICFQPHSIVQADWKFGNPDYGSPKYYDETDFFISLAISASPNIGQYKSIVHFPQHDYTLPIREYSVHQAAKLQTRYLRRIEKIVTDKFHKPIPGKMHCRFCDQRSLDAGGTGKCKHTVF